MQSFLLSFLYLIKNKPDLIFGMGGYSSIQFVFLRKYRNKFFIYENNLLAESNRLLSLLQKNLSIL